MATLQQPDITPFITHVLAENGVSPRALHLEISEHTTLEIVNASMGALRSLRALGVELALDDFGTGSSSLSHLKEVPFSYFKLDQSFVANIGKAVADEKIIKAMIMLGHDLGLGVVAEGVETREQIAFLQQHHCDKIQGNWVGKPMELAEMIDLL
jgi:EAL domain-containing protein (putative c-di-GMP-specific phosphodiesterase class I)